MAIVDPINKKQWYLPSCFLEFKLASFWLENSTATLSRKDFLPFKLNLKYKMFEKLMLFESKRVNS